MQGMKGGAAAAEIAFTAAQLAAGPAPPLHEAFISALARAGQLPQVHMQLQHVHKCRAPADAPAQESGGHLAYGQAASAIFKNGTLLHGTAQT